MPPDLLTEFMSLPEKERIDAALDIAHGIWPLREPAPRWWDAERNEHWWQTLGAFVGPFIRHANSLMKLEELTESRYRWHERQPLMATVTLNADGTTVTDEPRLQFGDWLPLWVERLVTSRESTLGIRIVLPDGSVVYVARTGGGWETIFVPQ